jgi:hypothetical protein
MATSIYIVARIRGNICSNKDQASTVFLKKNHYQAEDVEAAFYEYTHHSKIREVSSCNSSVSV